MSVVARFHPTGMTTDQYEEARRRVEETEGKFPPDGLDYHVCFGPDGDLRVSEIWDSQEEFDGFVQRLRPILTDVGIQLSGNPEVFEVHNVVKR
jgi:hypothetical protein